VPQPDSLEMGEWRLLWPGQHCRPNCGLGHGQLQCRRPGGQRGHKESRLGYVPLGGLFSYLQELGFISRYRWRFRCGWPPGRQMEGLQLVTVPGGGSGCSDRTRGRAGPMARGPGLWAGAGILSEARGFPEIGPSGHAAQRWVTHPSGGRRHLKARLRPPQAQRVPLCVLRGQASIWEATLRRWGWQQGAWALGVKGMSTGQVGKGWLPGYRHWGRWIGWRVGQSICGAEKQVSIMCWRLGQHHPLLATVSRSQPSVHAISPTLSLLEKSTRSGLPYVAFLVPDHPLPPGSPHPHPTPAS
jgi:hypothetical protein